MPSSELMSSSGDAKRQALLVELQGIWEEQARADPLWAILSERSKLGRGWQLDRFLATGEEQVCTWLKRIEDSKIHIRTQMAVDFGCGIGRLTQPLGRRFDHAIGIDIAPTMLRIARAINPHPEKIEFVLNTQDDLAVIPTDSSDLVVSHITLQHIKPEISERYLREFFRILRPGGVILFQLPSHLVFEDNGDTIATNSPHRTLGTDQIPPEACFACIRLLSAECDLTTNAESIVRVSVENVSSTTWHQGPTFPLNVGNHWLAADGASVVFNDDGRTSLPSTMAPGQRAELELRILAPSKPGKYVLEIDIVQEGIQWFATAGSQTLRIPVNVKAGRGEGSGEPYELPGLIDTVFRAPRPFEMHGIRKKRVLEIVHELGGEVFAVDEHAAEWHSYGYYVHVPSN